MKSKYYNQFTQSEISIGYAYMCAELNEDLQISYLLDLAWSEFECGLFSYDGATFCKDRNENTIFEVSAFIHDWRNSNGYVGKEIDKEMFSIMIALNYSQELIFERYLWTRLTWINKIRHKLLNNYKKELPTNLYNYEK